MYRRTTTDLQRHSGAAQESCALRRQGSYRQENGEVTEPHEFQRLAGNRVRRYDVDETTHRLRRKNKNMITSRGVFSNSG